MKVAVLIPCYNEGLTISKVVSDFNKNLPEADIYVYDNNSNDGTDNIARESGAIVRYEYRQGKGNVMRSMFSEIDADIYVLVDGDDTYPAEFVPQMIDLVASGKADMVIGDRLSNGTYTSENKRAFHNFGNNLVKKTINSIFKSNVKDIMTGLRVFNKTFIKNYPILSKGFEVETEMTLHALDKNFKLKEVEIDYRDRPEGSVSKLNTVTDGIKVIKTIIRIFKDFKPMSFFGITAVLLMIIGFSFGAPVLYEFLMTGFVRHIPLAILAAAIELLATMSLVCGLILDTVVKIDKRNYELRLMDFIGKYNNRLE